MKLYRIAVLALAITAICASGLQAQQITATLRGKVIDTDGVGLPGVPVSVSSGTHGSAGKTVMTDIEGRFKFQLLPPSNDYFIKINYPGFAPIELGPIDLDPGKTTVQDVTLRTSAELTETVEVVAHGNVVDTESTKTSSTFNTEFIEGLPIIGRNYQDILTLTPGVTDSDGDGNPNVQGARETGLQIRLDGGNITDPVSGTFGQNLNSDAIEEIEVISAGASAEYGRADGGFANIITKSGGNDMEGSFRAVWRGQILDGDGAGENVDTFVANQRVEFDNSDTRYYGTLGGAIVKDKLWYFVSAQKIDTRTPINLAGASFTRSSEGWYNFAKATWQVNSDNKLALQWNSDFREFRGLFLGFGVEDQFDGIWNQGGNTYQLRWTSIISPTLLLETLITAFDSGIAISPVSSDFHEIDITTRVNRLVNQVTLQAEFPIKECSTNGLSTGFIPNCDPSLGDPSIAQFNLQNGTVTGPLNGNQDDSRIRNSVKTDLTYTLEDAWGEHQIKSGLEFADEKFADEPINNPFLVTNYEPCPTCRINGVPIPNAIQGFALLTSPQPTTLDQRAVSFNSSAYITDTWKPRPNLTLNVGVRIDREDIDTSGFDYFLPRNERRKSIAIVEGLCDDGLRISQTGTSVGQNTAESVCDLPTRLPGQLPTPLIYAFDEQTPEDLRKWDINDDGIFNSSNDRINGLPVQQSVYTDFPSRSPQNFEITNLNLSPRFSVSWDPWADGKTKVFTSWGRYFDRLFLSTVSGEIGPDTVNYRFNPASSNFQFNPGMLSQNTSAVSVQQVDRNVRTPFTDVFTVGIEREIAPEWSAKVTYTQRLGWDLLQDTDFNHIQCLDFDEQFGIDPADICTAFLDSQTGKPVLSDDLFGAIGAPDLYNVNPNFNQVLRVGNFNSSRYRSIALELNKRLHRNWQMQTSYTFSKAEGQAEAFGSALGNDPSTADDEEGYLAFDQRHRVLVITTTQLPKDVELGASISWESGIPYSIQAQVVDTDDVNNTFFRTFYPSRQRNDQRNDGFWGIDAKVVKRFLIGKVQAAGEFAVNNLLNDDDLTLSAYRPTSISGVQLVQGPQGLRRFGRFWEVSFSMNF